MSDCFAIEFNIVQSRPAKRHDWTKGSILECGSRLWIDKNISIYIYIQTYTHSLSSFLLGGWVTIFHRNLWKKLSATFPQVITMCGMWERLSECVWVCVRTMKCITCQLGHGNCLMRYWLAIESIDFWFSPSGVCVRVCMCVIVCLTKHPDSLKMARERKCRGWMNEIETKESRKERGRRGKLLWRIVVWHFSWLPMPCTDTPILTLHLSPGASDSLAWVPCASLDSPSWQSRQSRLQSKKILVTSDASVDAQSNLR